MFFFKDEPGARGERRERRQKVNVTSNSVIKLSVLARHKNEGEGAESTVLELGEERGKYGECLSRMTNCFDNAGKDSLDVLALSRGNRFERSHQPRVESNGETKTKQNKQHISLAFYQFGERMYGNVHPTPFDSFADVRCVHFPVQLAQMLT